MALDNHNTEIDFDQYYAIVMQDMAEQGWGFRPDVETVRSDFNNGVPPSYCAELFVKECEMRANL
ncbi:MAG: hypothetical protein WKF87_06915 [Chryseolinea sp.]